MNKLFTLPIFLGNVLLNTAKAIKPLLFIALFCFTGWNSAWGQASTAGCNYSGTKITVGTSCVTAAMNSNANNDYWNSASGCNSGDLDDVWWWFTATSTSTTITYRSASDAIIHLFSGACSTGMTALACADAGAAGVAETITYTTVVGLNYAVRAQRYNSDNSMTGTICVVSPCIEALSAASISGLVSPCVNSSVVYTATSTGSGTENWTFPLGWNITAGQGSASVTVTVGANSGSISCSRSNTCGSTSSSNSISAAPVTGVPTITAGPTASGASCVGGSLTTSVTAGNSPASYQWQRYLCT